MKKICLLTIICFLFAILLTGFTIYNIVIDNGSRETINQANRPVMLPGDEFGKNSPMSNYDYVKAERIVSEDRSVTIQHYRAKPNTVLTRSYRNVQDPNRMSVKYYGIDEEGNQVELPIPKSERKSSEELYRELWSKQP